MICRLLLYTMSTSPVTVTTALFQQKGNEEAKRECGLLNSSVAQRIRLSAGVPCELRTHSLSPASQVHFGSGPPRSPTVRYGHSMVQLGDSLFVFAGHHKSLAPDPTERCTNDLWQFDLKTQVYVGVSSASFLLLVG